MRLLQHALGSGLQLSNGLGLWVLRCKVEALIFRGPVLSRSRAQEFLPLGLPDEGSYKAGEQWSLRRDRCALRKVTLGKPFDSNWC